MYSLIIVNTRIDASTILQIYISKKIKLSIVDIKRQPKSIFYKNKNYILEHLRKFEKKLKH